MPGLTGLEVLERMKSIRPEVPVVMITKSEEESIMEMAIGSKIADYLIKPVNPNQVTIVSQEDSEGQGIGHSAGYARVSTGFRKAYHGHAKPSFLGRMGQFLQGLLRWELELDQSSEDGLKSVLATQKNEANELFGRFISNNYEELVLFERIDQCCLTRWWAM